MSEKKAFKRMKVFDCQWDPGMPDDVKEAFFSFFECGNDVIVSWTVHDERFSPEDENTEWFIKKKKVNDWLVEHGAKPAKDEDSEGETVLIKHWW
jgi:hypothetical protein